MTEALNRHSDQSLTEQLVQRFAHRIEHHLLPPGTRLPSVRECARTHQVSPYTVVAAYDQLQARGLVEARSQRGFYVRTLNSERPRTSPPPRRSPFEPTQPIDATALIRGMFHAPGQRAMPALGTLPPSWLDAGMLGAALRRVTQGNGLEALSLNYGDPAGDLRLRHALTHRLDEIGLKVDPGQLITTVGGAHALDTVSRTLLRAGDAVLVDEPGWAAEFARLQLMGMRILPVPRGVDGPDLNVLAQLARAHQPKLYVTVSVLHNPTSAMLSPGHAHQVLRLAEEHDFHILEDDIYAFLAPRHATRLSVLDELRRTIHISSFSKVLAPGWRVGYIAAPPSLVDRFTNTKLLSTLTTPPVLEQALAHCMEQGQLRRHCERVVSQLDAARARCMQLARHAGCQFITPPQGLFGWVDVGVDTERLTHPMLDAGWLIAPGTLFLAQRQPSTLMRINMATSQDAAFWKALQRARDQLR
ncbi:PLP-dependent aminotransferase family protein [Aquabacterium sp. A3]|uniref:aminotransferase-like domain-containing protein n=1 Tax=Aquabacterium sp. A3 TaxID=3132829 RepID=UPI003119DF79